MAVIEDDRADESDEARELADITDPEASGPIIGTSDFDVSALRAKSGWRTSQGALTALVVIGAVLHLAFGPTFTPERLQTTAAAIFAFAERLGPIVAAATLLIRYVDSRGKIQSNELWANAAVRSPLAVAASGHAPLMAQGLLGGGLKDLAGAALGGSGWKDPARYGSIADLVAQVAGGKAGQVISSVRGKGATEAVTSGDFETVVRAILGRLEELEKAGPAGLRDDVAALRELVFARLDDLALITLVLRENAGPLTYKATAGRAKISDAVHQAAQAIRDGSGK